MYRVWLMVVLVTALVVSTGWAVVGDPQIRTDHPIYPGELAYSTLDHFAQSIAGSGDWGLGLGDSERDVAIKLWLWKMTHTLHDYTPKLWSPIHEYCRVNFKTHTADHPTRPDPTSATCISDEDTDSLRWTFSFGYALCTTLHSNVGPQIQAVGQALGKDWRSRCVNIPDDTNHEIYFGGKWHVFDVNAGDLIWSNNDANTAEMLSFKDVFGAKGGSKRPEVLSNAPKFNGKYLPELVYGSLDPTGKPRPFGWMLGILRMPALYWNSDEVGQKFPGICLMYYSGYNACPILYGLKKGETFVRWFSGDDARRDLALPKPIWWGSNIKGGPGSLCYYSNYLRDLPEYCKDAEPLVLSQDGQIDNEHVLRDFKVSTHTNGMYDWQPNLAADDWKEGAVTIEGLVKTDSSGITAEGPASITLGFFSPYIIAGMPADDGDPAIDGASNGAILDVRAIGDIPVEVSVNNGLSFKGIGLFRGDGRIDFTDAVKGRNQYLLRINLDKEHRLESLRLRTVVTICRAMYPKLKSGKTTITYQAGGLDAFDASPDFSSVQLAAAPGSFVSQKDLAWAGYSTNEVVAWRTESNTGSCVYQMTSPTGNLVSVSAAADLTWPSPTCRDAWGEIAVGASPDGPWTTIGKVDPQAGDAVGKNVTPYYWVYGTADVSRQSLKTAYIRVQFAGAGKPCGLRFLHLYGTYQTGNTSPITVTYYWQSEEEIRHHSETIPAGEHKHSCTIDTGKNVKNLKVVFAVPASR